MRIETVKQVMIRNALKSDLPAINRVIEAAVMGWHLPERVKRLSLPSYRYTEIDSQHLHMVVAEVNNIIVGVAAWEPADLKDTPDQKVGLLLHGIYVDPEQQGKGIGKLLLHAAIGAATQAKVAGLLVKAQKDAEAFFAKQGLQKISVQNEARDYVSRYWLSV